MKNARVVTPGPPREDCTRCNGLGKVSTTGPRCPRCQGRGVEPLRRVVGSPITDEQQAVLERLSRLADERDGLDSDFDRGELNDGVIRDTVNEAYELQIAVRHIVEALRVSRQRVHQIQYGLKRNDPRRWT